MTSEKQDEPSSIRAVLDEAFERGRRDADPQEVADADRRLDELLDKVADPPVSVQPAPAPQPLAGSGALAGVAMRSARPLSLQGRKLMVEVRGVDEPVLAELAAGVSAEIVEQAIVNGDHVMLECGSDQPPLVVGALMTRIPEHLVLRARKLHLEGDEEVLLRSGRGAMRIRRDGDVELVGGRISAMSRGLFRLVGRVLRLN